MRWAKLMQLEMQAGKPLADIAAATRDEADDGDLPPYGELMALSVLILAWKYSDQLEDLAFPVRWYQPPLFDQTNA